MARLSIGTNPVQAARPNINRLSLSVQYLPAGIIAGNIGLIYGKFGSAPKADPLSNTWDFILNPGATEGTNLDESLAKAPLTEDLWLISDTADQIVSLTERYVPENNLKTE